MDRRTLFEGLCFVFSIGFYIPYITLILLGKAKPTLSSWISWFVMDAAILAAIMAKDAISFQLVGYVIGTGLLLIVCAWKRASLDWTRLDSFSLGASGVAGILWYVFNNPDIAIALSLLAMALGSIPLYVNTWRNPRNEDMLSWILCAIGGIFALALIDKWDIATALTPSVFFVLQWTLLAFMCRRFLLKRPKYKKGDIVLLQPAVSLVGTKAQEYLHIHMVGWTRPDRDNKHQWVYDGVVLECWGQCIVINTRRSCVLERDIIGPLIAKK